MGDAHDMRSGDMAAESAPFANVFCTVTVHAFEDCLLSVSVRFCVGRACVARAWVCEVLVHVSVTVGLMTSCWGVGATAASGDAFEPSGQVLRI